ncbi:DNA methyltransferase [Novosphingobium sp. RD2P27]|uniref:site-specific DNA-methyltransferase (adenine-specific) n=1 Tax=Novosphingobium kalidii TaxID=3230299 RepID=A0ABV2D0Z1_9SPHN
MSSFDALVTKLREIFQIDRPELDFGVYRILNARAGEIDGYLTTRLKEQVAEAFTASAAANTDALAKELTEKIAQYQADGVNPDTVPAVQKLREAIAAATTGASEHENQVFSHLLTFFSRYYDKGDFISQRRYKGDTYAIPYSGEEVVLHWANKDQYYTKSGEAFSNYGFKLQDGRSVQFRLVAADTAKDNRKDNDKERRFVLAESRTVTRIDEDGEEYDETIVPVSEEDGRLVIRFDYKAMPKGTKQDALVSQAVAAVLGDETVKAKWLGLTERAPTDSNPQRTIMEKCLTNYTQKNTADYFIHKNLGGFLRRELDFYIKNEIMNLDDVQNAAAFGAIEKNLRMIQCLRTIALHLIAFLAQIEDFQKKLWLKKKFVVSAHYCVTLDRVPEALYPAIAANPAQWEQWHDLGMRESAAPGGVDDLKASLYLMVDTALFDASFRADLLKALPDLDASTDGLLINGDNFQALTLIGERYRDRVQSVYIDPPYNTDASAIIYKNGYKYSSWNCLIDQSVQAAVIVSHPTAIICGSIDDTEVSHFRSILHDHFTKQIGIAVVKSNPQSRKASGKFSPVHEYCMFFGRSDTAFPSAIGYDEKKAQRYPLTDDRGRYAWMNFIRAGNAELRTDRPKLHYPIWVYEDGRIHVPAMEWNESAQAYDILEPIPPEVKVVHPIKNDNGNTIEKRWQRGIERVRSEYSEYRSRIDNSGTLNIDFKTRLDADAAPTTWWDKGEYASANFGAPEMDAIVPGSGFDYPKTVAFVRDALRAAGAVNKQALCLDFFAGSGTTGHAVISANRLDGGSRKYILIEQGAYFSTALKPRMQKAVFSADWASGRAQSAGTGISHAFKVLRIESYEDTLNNLNLQRNERQGALLDGITDQARMNYLMHYMLNVEARESLLSVEDFRKPFDYTLNITVDSAGAYEPRKVDLVETFNYLIGLTVRHIDIQHKPGFVTVEGTLPTGEKTLILWRDCEVLDYEGLTRLCDKLAVNPADSEYEIVYINGDHNIPSALTTSEAEGEVTKVLKLRQIEPAFLEAMFSNAEGA